MTKSRCFRRLLLAGLCASALVVGACSRADKSAVEEITVAADSLDLSGADLRALERHFVVEPRDGPEADVLAALDALGLGEVTDGRIIDGTTVTYTDWRAEQDGTVAEADRVVLRGVHMSDDGATFDIMAVEDLDVGDAEDAMDLEVDALFIVEPSPGLAQQLVDVVRGVDTAGVDEAAEIAASSQFRALRVEGVSVEVEEDDIEVDMALNQFIAGYDRPGEELDIVLESLSFAMEPNDAMLAEALEQDPDMDPAARAALSAPTRLDMDGMTLLGMRLTEDALSGSPEALMALFQPSAEPPFRQLDVGAMSLDSAMVAMDTDGMEVDTQSRGDVLTTRSVFLPSRIDIKDTPMLPEAVATTLRDNGLMEITFRGSSTSAYDAGADRMSVSEAQFEFDDSLRTNCDYALSGLKAAQDALDASGVSLPDSAWETEEELDAFLSDMNTFQQAQAEANANIKLEGLDCTIQDVADNSFVTRAYAVASELTGMPVPVLKGQAKTVIAMSSLTAQNEFQRDLMDTLGSGLIDFLDTPGQTLRIVSEPAEPVSVMSLAGENASIAPLGLQVTVE